MPTVVTDLQRIAKKVSRHRAARGWTHGQLAEAAGVSRRTVLVIERAERRVHDFTYGRVAIALEIPLTQLIGEEK